MFLYIAKQRRRAGYSWVFSDRGDELAVKAATTHVHSRSIKGVDALRAGVQIADLAVYGIRS